MLKKIAIGLLVLVFAFVALVATQPAHFHIERSASIAAPPELVFSFINDFRRWGAWSPWEKLDPNMKREYSGSPSGAGAKYDWAGNDDVGEGGMRIEESQPPSRVSLEIEFRKPWQATNQTTFSITPTASGSDVTWGMDGTSDFMFKAVGLVMNMDETVGKDFQAGLENLKRVAEAESSQRGNATP
jgi:uncharacterized protein YndB with AHSA1/START domain